MDPAQSSLDIDSATKCALGDNVGLSGNSTLAFSSDDDTKPRYSVFSPQLNQLWDLNERYQTAISNLQRLGSLKPSLATTEQQMRTAGDVREIIDEFETRALNLMKTIIDEMLLPPSLRTIQPTASSLNPSSSTHASSAAQTSGPVYIHDGIMLALLAPSIRRAEENAAGLGLGLLEPLDGSTGGESFSVASGAWLDDADVISAQSASEERLSSSILLNQIFKDAGCDEVPGEQCERKGGDSGDGDKNTGSLSASTAWNPLICVPAVCQVDYLGFRGLAKMCFPLSANSKLLYGPTPRAVDNIALPRSLVVTSECPEVVSELDKVARNLNIKLVSALNVAKGDDGKVKYAHTKIVPNLKIFKCQDERNYIPSTTSILAPDLTSSAADAASRILISSATEDMSNVQKQGADDFYASALLPPKRVVPRKHLRPELLARLKSGSPIPVTLSSAATNSMTFESKEGDIALPSGYAESVEIEAKESYSELVAASALLHTKVIPEFAMHLDACNPLPSCGSKLAELMHERGINMRYLGKLARACKRPHTVILCLTEMIARSCKAILRSIWRRVLLQHSALAKVYTTDILSVLGVDENVSQDEGKDKGELLPDAHAIMTHIAVTIVNLALGHGSASDDFWNAPLRRTVEYKFGFKLVLSGSTMGPRAKAKAAALANAAAKAAAAANAAAEAAATASASAMSGEASAASSASAAAAANAAATAASRAKAALDHREDIHRPTLFLALQRQLGLIFRDSGTSKYGGLVDSDPSVAYPVRREDLLGICPRLKSSLPDLLRTDRLEHAILTSTSLSAKDGTNETVSIENDRNLKARTLICRYLASHLPDALRSNSKLWMTHAQSAILPWEEWLISLITLLSHNRNNHEGSNLRPMVLRVFSHLLSLMLKGGNHLPVEFLSASRAQALSIASFLLQTSGNFIESFGETDAEELRKRILDSCKVEIDGSCTVGTAEHVNRWASIRRYDMSTYPLYLTTMQVAFSASRTSNTPSTSEVKISHEIWDESVSPFAKRLLGNTSLAPSTIPDSWSKSMVAIFATEMYSSALSTHSFCMGARQPHVVFAHVTMSVLHELALETSLALLSATRAAVRAKRTLGVDHEVSVRLKHRRRLLSSALAKQRGESLTIASSSRANLALNTDDLEEQESEQHTMNEARTSDAKRLLDVADEFAGTGEVNAEKENSLDTEEKDAEEKYLAFLAKVTNSQDQ